MTDTLVQFAAPVCFVKEADEGLTIDIIRLGCLACTSSVDFKTLDGSAKAGVKYQHVEGKVVFKEGEHLQSIKVQIVQDETWSPTLEFKIALMHQKGCILVPDGKLCRVKIIDDDLFPSNKYRADLERGPEGIDQINQWGLFVEYVKLNLSTPGMMWRSAVTILFDEMHNLYLFFLLKARTYLVNVVFDQDDPNSSSNLFLFQRTGDDIEDRIAAAQLVALTYLSPMLFLHVWDYAKTKMDLEGRTRMFMQTCMFRKYLNYTEASRQKVRVSHMQVAITNNTVDLGKAFCSVLRMAQMLGKLGLLLIFMLSQDPSAAYMLVLMPSILLVCACCRSRALSRASEFAGPLKKVLIDLTTETCAKYRLIADYAQRPQMNELFARRASELRRSLIPEVQVELNNNYIPRWLGPGFICMYIAFNARCVLTHELTLGVFLATLSVLSEASSDFTALYEHIMSVNTRLDALMTLTKYFNMETEVGFLSAISEQRRVETRKAFHDVLALPAPVPGSGYLRSDLIPIKLDAISFTYGNMRGCAPTTVFKNVNLTVEQGKLVAVVGCHGSGKGTFLRLMAQTLFPSTGNVFVPMHLKVLFVAQLPVLFDRSPWYNLVFGRPDFDDVEMLRDILTELNMTRTLQLLEEDRHFKHRDSAPHVRSMTSEARISTISVGTVDYAPLTPLAEGAAVEAVSDDDVEVGESGDDDERQGLLQACCSAVADTDDPIELNDNYTWQEMLSFTEQVKICLVRALLMNPEVLVLHRPLHNYDSFTQEAVLSLLRRHNKNRGLGLPASDLAHRRPRTCFFTPESMEQAASADVIWHIDADDRLVTAVRAEDMRRDFTVTKQGEFTRKTRKTAVF